MPKNSVTKRAYVEATGKAPDGPAFEAWLQKKTGGDFSDSNMDRVFGGGGDPTPLGRGEKTIPQKRYMEETSKMKPIKKSVEVGVSDSKKKSAIDRVKSNMRDTEERQRRWKQSKIETY